MYDCDDEVLDRADHVFFIPPAPELLSPILEIVPLQLLACHIAVRRGCDVDQPRNLAKSVTVEKAAVFVFVKCLRTTISGTK